MIEFGVLGTLSIHRRGTPVTLRARALRRLLAALLCRPGHALTAPDLADTLWDDAPSPGARGTVHVYVHRLRRALGEDVRLAHGPAGYQLQVERDQLDALRFTDLVADGRAARRRGELDQASARLAQALDLWRGPAYADLTASRLIADEAHRLEEQRLLTRQERIEVELDLGRHASMVPDLAELAGTNPYHERVRALHMLALYRSGRQAPRAAGGRGRLHGPRRGAAGAGQAGARRRGGRVLTTCDLGGRRHRRGREAGTGIVTHTYFPAPAWRYVDQLSPGGTMFNPTDRPRVAEHPDWCDLTRCTATPVFVAGEAHRGGEPRVFRTADY